MAKIKFDMETLLKKIGIIFLRDSFIAKNNFVFAGKETSDESVLESFVELHMDFVPVLTNLYPNSHYLFIPNIREAKKDPETNIITNIDDNLLKYSEKKYNKLSKLVNNIACWNNLKLTEEEISMLFDDSLCIELFAHDNRYPSVIVNKKMFPLVKKDKTDSVLFHIEESKKQKGLYTIIFKYIDDSMTVYNVVQYVKM